MTEAEWLASEDPVAMLSSLSEGLPTPSGYALGHRLRGVGGRVSDRKLRLYAVAASRALGMHTRERLSAVEEWADGGPKPQSDTFGYEAESAADAAEQVSTDAFAMAYVSGGATNESRAWASSLKADLLREVVGNPFRPVKVEPAWLTPTVLSLAQAAYENRDCPSCLGTGMCRRYNPVRRHQLKDGPCPRCCGTKQLGHLDPVRLGVLSDALEEAGCTDEAILRHLRGFRRCKACARERQRNADQCECSLHGGWVYRPDEPHVRGCHVLDRILGKE